jgi:molybdopterin/thiamine biosynthesis adenylyltransferase
VIAYLAAAGVGTIGVVDHDMVSISNLQRQFIHRTQDEGVGKAQNASTFVAALNPHVVVVPYAVRLDAGNADALVMGYDLVLDGTDDFATRRFAAAAASRAGRPLISGAVSMWDGQLTVFMAGGKTFDDFYPVIPDPSDLPSCEAVGVLGPVTGVIGTLMAMEAIKLITGAGEPLAGRLLLYNGRSARFTEVEY